MSFIKTYLDARDLGKVYIPLRLVTLITLAACTFVHATFNASRRPDDHKMYAYYMFPFWTIPNLFLVLFTLTSLLDLLCTTNGTRDGKPANSRRILTVANDFFAGAYFFSIGVYAAVYVPMVYTTAMSTLPGDIATCAGGGALCLVASVAYFGLLVCSVVGFRRHARDDGAKLRLADEQSLRGSVRSSYASSHVPAQSGQMAGPSGPRMLGAQPEGWSRQKHASMVGVRL